MNAPRPSARGVAVLAAAGALLSAYGCAPGGSTLRATLVSPEGGIRAAFYVTIARTEAARRRGLRDSPPLQMDEGLLLEFPVQDEVCISNTGVESDIDAVFINDERRVTRVISPVAANDPGPFCVEGTRSVLEVAVGAASEIEPGDQLRTERL